MLPTDGLERARQLLKRHFGYAAFRGAQEAAVEAVLRGRDVLVLMPTGGGKSLCYQIPALVLDGVTLVVSPLISLMKDQVDTLTGRGIPATFINSTLPPGEAGARLEAAARGEVKLLYIAPERFDADTFRRACMRLNVRLLAVDEAHCISEWGHGFRPSYLRLGRVREMLRCPVIALTATATPDVRDDIVAQLALRRPLILARGFDRPNLGWHVVAARDAAAKDRFMIRALRERPDGAAIVYAPTRKSVDAIADMLNHAGVPAAAYHGGASPADRQRIQEEFIATGHSVIIATSAFGMGIDKPDVRLVLHFAMPASLESYYQEAGRAGRDGGRARCVLLHAYADRFTHEFLIDQAHPDTHAIRSVWAALAPRNAAGGLVRCTLAELAARAGLDGGPRQAHAVLRVLAGAGVIHADERPAPGGAPGMYHIRPTVDAPVDRLPVPVRNLSRLREREYARLASMQRYAYAAGCRRAFILRYFGETGVPHRCTDCDRCSATPERAGRAPRGLRHIVDRWRRA